MAPCLFYGGLFKNFIFVFVRIFRKNLKLLSECEKRLKKSKHTKKSYKFLLYLSVFYYIIILISVTKE